MGRGAVGRVDAHRIRAASPAPVLVCSFEGRKEGTTRDGGTAGTPPRLGTTGQQGPRTLGR